MKAGYDGSIRIDTRINEQGFNQGIASMSKSMTKFAKVLSVAKATQILIEIGKEAINLASDLQEVQNVVDTAFGDMSYKVEDFAKTTKEQFGMSELAAKKTSSTYMAMARGMGINGEAASDMSIALAGLTGDMASFYNVSQDIADTALKSVFTGETESLKQFGVVMTQANLQQFAYTQGITKKISAMSQSEQVMLRYQFVMQKLGLAQGDFTKTSGSWANQTRLLTENWKELLAIVGGGLTEILLPVVKFLNTVLELLIKIANKIGDIYTALTGKKIVKSNKAIGDSANYAADAETGLADGIGTATKAAKNALAAFDELDVLQQDLGSGSGGGGGGFFPTDFGGGLTETGSDLNGLKSEFDNFFVEINDKFKGLGDALAVPIQVPAPVFAEIPSPVWNPNWGLDDAPIRVPAPVFGEIPNPVYNPNWNLNESLMPETAKAYITFYTWGLQMQENMSIVADSLRTNSSIMAEDVAVNFGEFQSVTQRSMESWGGSVSSTVFETASNSLANLNEFFSTSYDNLGEWMGSSNENYLTWGNGMIRNTAEIADGMNTSWAEGLETMWDNFKEFASATGEKLSGSFKAVFNPIPYFALGVAAIMQKSMNLTSGNFKLPKAIPAHAKGAVIPPNSEYLAILGDQKSGRNIEAPEGLIRQIMQEELAGMQTPEIKIIASANEGQLIQYMKFRVAQEDKRMGMSLIEGGA